MKHLKTQNQLNETSKNFNISDIRSSKKINEQLENHDEKERLEYERGIKLYKQALENIEEAMILFENSPWGMPEELDRYFNESNEVLWTLQKEASHLKEDMDDLN